MSKTRKQRKYLKQWNAWDFWTREDEIRYQWINRWDKVAEQIGAEWPGAGLWNSARTIKKNRN